MFVPASECRFQPLSNAFHRVRQTYFGSVQRILGSQRLGKQPKRQISRFRGKISVPLLHSASPRLRAITSVCILLLAGAVSLSEASAQVTNTNTVTNGGTIGSGTTALITNPATSITGAITNNGLLLFGQTNSTVTDSFVISGSGSLTVSGLNGITILTGNNTYTGTTLISAGTLQIGTNGTNGNLPLGPIIDNGNLQISMASTLTISTNISGTGLLSQAGSGTTILSASNGYTGGTKLYAGTLQVAANNAIGSGTVTFASNGAVLLAATNLTLSNAVVLTTAGTFSVAGGSTLTETGLISGAGGLTVTNSGTLIVTATNTFTGVALISSSSTLQIGNGGVGGTIDSASSITNNGTLIFNLSGSNSFSTPISGTGSVIKNGIGTTTLTGINVYSGTTTINAGTLVFGYTPGFNNVPTYNNIGTITVNNGGTLSSGGYNELGGGSANTNTVQVIVNSGGVINSGGTVISLNNLILNGGQFQATGGFGASWGAAVFTGTLSVTADSSIVSVSGANNFISPGAFNGNQTLTVDVASGVTLRNELPFQNWGSSPVYSIIKAGSGTMILTGDSTYTGTTTISAGTVVVGTNGTTGSLGTGAITDNAQLTFNLATNLTVASAISGSGTISQVGSGTLLLTASNNFTGNWTIGTNSSLQVGNNGTTGSLGSGLVTNNGSLIINRTGAQSFSAISGTGDVSSIGAGTITLTGSNTYTGDTYLSGNTRLLLASNATLSGTMNINLGRTNSQATLDFNNTPSVFPRSIIMSPFSNLWTEPLVIVPTLFR